MMKKLFICFFVLLIYNQGISDNKVRVKGFVAINQDFDVTVTVTGEDFGSKVLVKTKAINGQFCFELEPVKVPVMAFLYFLGSGHGIILENADIKFDYSHEEGSRVSGGHYNEILYSWERTEETRYIYSSLLKINRSTDFKNISPDSLRVIRSEQNRMRNQLQKMENDHLASIKSDTDPYLKLFAVLESKLKTNSDMELLKELDEVFHSNPDIQKILKNAESEKKRSEIERSVAVGGNLIDFVSSTLGGQKMKLSETVKKNKYTLLEIWASWCSPCRNDIKKLPPIYSKYNDLGFEIFAVSLDEKKDQWEKASAEMSMPWINTHFISGTKDDVGGLYGIKSIPKNVLYDTEGKIVAIDIKGEKLEKFLQEKL